MGNRMPKRVSFTFAVVAITLAMASVAYGCTTFKGQLDVTANGGTSTAIGKGNDGMKYCSNPTGGATADKGTNESVTVTVSAASCGGTSYKLTDRGTNGYYVNFINWGKCTLIVDCTGFKINSSGNYTWWYDCMGTNGGTYGHPLGTMTVDGNGYGTVNVTITSAMMTKVNGASDASGICVSNSTAAEGNQAPIAVI